MDLPTFTPEVRCSEVENVRMLSVGNFRVISSWPGNDATAKEEALRAEMRMTARRNQARKRENQWLARRGFPRAQSRRRVAQRRVANPTILVQESTGTSSGDGRLRF